MAKDSGIQIDEGDFTRLHNLILEKLALARFTASEYRCLMFLFRMTYGWRKKEDAISLSQWAKGVGIDPEKRHNVLRILQGLIAKNVIYAKNNGNNHPATWGFNKHFSQWSTSLFDESVISRDNKTVISRDNKTVISRDNKTVIPEDNSFDSTVITHDNKTVITGDNHKRKKESKAAAAAPSPTTEPPSEPFVESYQRVWGLLPESQYRVDQISEWAQRIPLPVWEYALKECADNHKVGQWRYLESILKRVEKDGLPSLNGVGPPTRISEPTVISVPR